MYVVWPTCRPTKLFWCRWEDLTVFKGFSNSVVEDSGQFMQSESVVDSSTTNGATALGNTVDDMSDDDFGPSIPLDCVNGNSKPHPKRDLSQLEEGGMDGDNRFDGELFEDDPYKTFLKRIPKEKAISKPKELILDKGPEKIYRYGEDEFSEEEDLPINAEHEQRLNAVNFSIPKGSIDWPVIVDNSWELPYTHEVLIRGHSKVITCLSLDYKGLRLVSGSSDSKIKFWDFYSMDRSFQSFNYIEPYSHTIVNSLSWNVTGEKLLVGLNNPQAIIYDREGVKQVEFAKGYHFATDMSNTNGHTSNICHAIWHPVDLGNVITVGEDSTCRIWDVNRSDKQKTVIKVKNSRGLALVKVTKVAMDDYGQYLAVGANDGSLQIFTEKGGYSRVSMKVPGAHSPNSDISGVVFSPNRDILISRGCDDETMKVWDLRKFQSPLKVFADLSNSHSQTDIVFNSSGRIVCTGTSLTLEKRVGCLAFADLNTLEMKVVSVASEDIVALNWHHRLNQIMAGCADGTIKVFFDERWSCEGVINALKRNIKQPEGAMKVGVSIMMPRGQRTLSERAKKRKLLKDPAFGHAPAIPHYGPGSHGLLGSSLKADYMKKILNMSNKNIFEDPREALLRQAGKDIPKEKYLDYEGLKKLEAEELERMEQIEKIKKRMEKD